jgi:hypothetical protein
VEKSRELLGTVTPPVQYGLTAALERHRKIVERRSDVGGVVRIAWSDAKQRLVFCGDRNQVELLDHASGEKLFKHPQLGKTATKHAVINEDGTHIAVAGDDAEVFVWAPTSQNPMQTTSWR